jgi:hypothetical protein
METESGAEPTRQHFHRRALEFDAFLRGDGLWEFEARIADRKPFRSYGMTGVERAPMQPYHDMWVRLTTDAGLLILCVATSMNAHPFALCQGAAESFQSLVGLHIGRGWRKSVIERVGGLRGCNHMMELLLPLPSMVIQATGYGRDILRLDPATVRQRIIEKRLAPVNSCFAWRADGPVAQEFAPHLREPPAD